MVSLVTVAFSPRREGRYIARAEVRHRNINSDVWYRKSLYAREMGKSNEPIMTSNEMPRTA